MIPFIWHSGKNQTIGLETDQWLPSAGMRERFDYKGEAQGHFLR